MSAICEVKLLLPSPGCFNRYPLVRNNILGNADFV